MQRDLCLGLPCKSGVTLCHFTMRECVNRISLTLRIIWAGPGWQFKCSLSGSNVEWLKSVKYQVHETNTVSPGLFLVLLWLWYSNTVPCKLSGTSLYLAQSSDGCPAGTIRAVWMGCPRLSLWGWLWLVQFWRTFASKIRVVVSWSCQRFVSRPLVVCMMWWVTGAFPLC